MRLVVIIGPPAVGKATVGKSLADGYGFKLFHNHVTLDMVANVFEWGTPPFGKLVEEFRQRTIEAAAENDIDIVFTYVWAFSEPDDGEPIRRYRETVLANGGQVFFVELQSGLEVRMARNGMEARRRMKRRSDEASSPEWIVDIDGKFSFDSGGRLPFDEPQVRLDTSDATPEETAAAIAAAFGFEPRERAVT